MTLNDLESRAPIAVLLTVIFRTVVQRLTRFQLTARRAVPLRIADPLVQTCNIVRITRWRTTSELSSIDGHRLK